MKSRGRPRQYDRDHALRRAQARFWRKGYSATSLDDLSDVTDMNKPSLYAAFGNKRTLYLLTLDDYARGSVAAIQLSLDRATPLREGLRRLYDTAIRTYAPGAGPSRGCYLLATALTESLSDPAVRTKLAEALRAFERELSSRFEAAKRDGELPASADPAALALLASAMLHTLAVRARAGESRQTLESIAATALAMLCPPATSASPLRARGPARKAVERRVK